MANEERNPHLAVVKVFLFALAGLLLAGIMIKFLVGTTDTFSRLTMTKEALDKAPDRDDGYQIVYQIVSQAAGDPSGSRIAVPPAGPSAFDSALGAVSRTFARMGSWRLHDSEPLTVPNSTIITTTCDISIRVEHGSIGPRTGTKLLFLSRNGANVQVRDASGANYVIPVSATDLK